MQRRLLFLACVLACVNCFSQQYPFVYYTPKDGLINSRVRTIKQDSRGRMYFITFGGLSIYDGTRFINFGQQDGMANEIVNDVIEITPDSFLVASNTKKLNTLVHDKIGVYQTSDGFCPTINRFFKSRDGYWYASADEGLFILKDKKFTRLPLVYHGTDIGQDLDKMIEWKNFFLMIPWNNEHQQKFIVYDKISQSVTDVVSGVIISSMQMDAAGAIWLVTTNGVKQADLTSLQKGKLVLRPAPARYGIIKPENSNVFFDPMGDKWFYGGSKIQKINPPFYEEIISVEQGLKTSTISDLFLDREGIIWMASEGNGVIKLKSTRIQILNTIIPGRQMIFYAVKQRDDTTWIFNRLGNCLYRVAGNEIKSFPLHQKLSVSNIYLIGNSLYLADDKRIVVVKQKDDPNSYSHLHNVLNDPHFTLGNGITDRHGTLIQYGHTDTGFLLLVIKNDKVLMKYNIGINYPLDQMAIDGLEHFWVATRNKHILAFSINPADPEHYLKLVKDFSKELPDVSPRSITVDKQNNVWIGTRYHGIYLLRLNNLEISSIENYTTKNGLSDNFVIRLTCDSNNTVWIGTQTGLDKIFLKNGNYIIGNISKNNNVFQAVPRIETSKNGTVWAVNNDGTLMKIIPSPGLASPAPPLLLTSIKVNDQASPRTMKSFSYRENNFLFSVAAPSFFDEESISYSYLLEGSGNNNWSEPSHLASFSFVNLSPGSYTLHVRSDFPEAMYPSQTLVYAFIIRRPWWQTWWFRLGIGALTLAMLTLTVRNYYGRKLEKQRMALERKQAIEKERTRIATDMHDDLGAGLSRIKFLSETIGIKKQQQQPIEEDITKIREYSHQMIDKMGEIVWALNEKNDSLSDLLAYTRGYAMEYLSQNGIECKVKMPDQFPSVSLSGEVRRNIFLSVKETLHNIVKHAQANTVVLSIQTDNDLMITIKDDGIGFSASDIRPFSNGLSNIDSRMKEIGGKSKIENSAGTKVSLSIPLQS